MTMNKIIITGGTGLIGSHLISFLKENYELIILTRFPQKYQSESNLTYIKWNGKELLTELLNGAYAIINLIGENIGGKAWSKTQKEKIKNSRVEAGEAIKKSLEHCEIPPKVWIQASAVGYYGQLGYIGVTSDEDSLKGENSFLAEVCEKWEEPIRSVQIDIRKTVIRTGVVLSPESLIMKQITMPFKFGIAVITGSGENWLPWIDIEDEVRAIAYLLKHESCCGVYNLVAPQNIRMRELVEEIKKHRRTWLTIHIPKFILEFLFGKEKTKEIVLTDQKVYPKNLLRDGFSFVREKPVVGS